MRDRCCLSTIFQTLPAGVHSLSTERLLRERSRAGLNSEKILSALERVKLNRGLKKNQTSRVRPCVNILIGRV